MARPKKYIESEKIHLRATPDDKQLLRELKQAYREQHGMGLSYSDLVRNGLHRIAVSLNIR